LKLPVHPLVANALAGVFHETGDETFGQDQWIVQDQSETNSDVWTLSQVFGGVPTQIHIELVLDSARGGL
jgi:hypothetical protein